MDLRLWRPGQLEYVHLANEVRAHVPMAICPGCSDYLALSGRRLRGAPEMGVDVNQILGESAPLDGTAVANGLKQALEVGTQRTTSTLSQAGAFRDDPFASVEPAG